MKSLEFFEVQSSGRLNEVVAQIARDVRGGQRLSYCFRRFPDVFSAVYSGLIQAGEDSGQLDAALLKLADLLERQNQLVQKMKSAATYPCVVFSMALLGGLGFIFFILPSLEPLLKSVGTEPPFPTWILLQLGTLMRWKPFWPLMIGLSIAGLVGSNRLYAAVRNSPSRAKAMDRAVLYIPVFGVLIRKVLMSRIYYTMAGTVDSGISVTESISLCRKITSNTYVSAELLRIRQELEDGKSVSDAFAVSPLVESVVVSLLAVGEETSSVSESLLFVAKLYDEFCEDAIHTMTAMFEPLMMGVMGFVACFLILATILPLVKVIQNL